MPLASKTRFRLTKRRRKIIEALYKHDGWTFEHAIGGRSKRTIAIWKSGHSEPVQIIQAGPSVLLGLWGWGILEYKGVSLVLTEEGKSIARELKEAGSKE